MANITPVPIEGAIQTRMQTRAVLRIIVLLLVVAALLWMLYKLTTIILLLILSIFFAYLVAPLVDLLQKPVRVGRREVRMPRAVAIGVVYAAIFLAIGFAIYFLVPQLANQFPEFKRQAGDYYKTISGTGERLNQYLKQHRMPDSMVDAVNNAALKIIQEGGGIFALAVEKMIGWLIYVPWLVLIPILSFFLLKDADSFRRWFLQILPRGRWRWRGDEFFEDINSTLAAYIRAQLTACLLVGIISSIGFALIGLPSPLVLGVIAGVLEFIPLVGPLTIAVLVAALAILHSGFGMALAVLLFLGVLRIVQDYVIYPRIIGHNIHLHPLAVILAILCGAELAGIAGVFLAIPVIAILTVSYRHWLEHRGSESIAEVLEEAAAKVETIAVEEAAAELTAIMIGEQVIADHPTSDTTPEEMARARPDLLTGELKLPKLE
jgi:predicted PurR-regulated permease PerM